MQHIPLGKPFRLINPKKRTSFYEKAHDTNNGYLYNVTLKWRPRLRGSPTRRTNQKLKRGTQSNK